MKEYTKNDTYSGKQILIFTADWCPDCIMLKNYLNEIIAENKDWEFIYIDTELYPDVAAEFGIMGIPSFVALNDSIRVDALISKEGKPKELINAWIEGINV